MNSTSAAETTQSYTSRTRKTVSNRLSSIFTNKNSQIKELRIDLDDQYKTYGPGSTVKGTVVLDLVRPLGVTHIVVCLYGFLQVFKNHRSSGKGQRNAGGRLITGGGKRWVTEYYGDGYAALFEEEVVLCGQGRLDPKLYHFQFELDFPSNFRLPTSINFERGTISYIVSSSITRLGAIATTTNCERGVEFKDDLDVGALAVPKPRAITLEPESRRSKGRYQINRLASYDTPKWSNASTASAGGQSSRTARTSASRDEHQTSQPPSPSATSSLSSIASRKRAQDASEPQSSQTSQIPPGDSERRNKRITASVGLGKAGCLAGERVPLQILITHHKPIHSVRGVIVTLYRQARVDMHPNLPLKSEDGGEAKYEDYYPRSKSGLGGLSLTAAGSSQEWRKDLSQTIVPFDINPHTLQAEISTLVRVPDDAFPSIRNAPGEMISFKYLVEVIIDINGKLASQDKGFANLGGMDSQSSHGVGTIGQIDDMNRSITAYGTNCIDTSRIRREKNAIVCLCDLIVGTRDSRKAKGKERSSNGTGNGLSSRGAHYSPRNGSTARDHYSDPHYHQGNSNGAYWSSYEDYEAWDPSWGGQYDWNGANYEYEPYSQTYLPESTAHLEANPRYDELIQPPPAAFDPNLSEKERARLAEERLLPSQPPGFAASSQSHAPSAPSYRHLANPGQSPLPVDEEEAGPSAPMEEDIDITPTRHAEVEWAPNGTSRTIPSDHNSRPMDKQEAELSRMAAMASEPQAEAGSTVEGNDLTGPPTAPTLDELHDEDGSGQDGTNISAVDEVIVDQDLPQGTT